MDIGLLADPTRCPDCAIGLPGTPPECPACGLPLRGHLADQLWRVSVAAAGMLEERIKLISRLRLSVSEAVRAGAPTADVPGFAPPAAQPHLGLSSGGGWLPPPRAYDGAPHRKDAADYSALDVTDPARPRQMQRVLLGLGVLLLSIAALIFTVVAWGRIGVGGRSLILATITGAAAYASTVARRRELPGTAESFALLTTAFLLLDAYGARSADLAGVGDSTGEYYWATVVGLMAALGAALWRVHPLHTVRHATVIAAQLPLLILGDRLPNATFAALLCAQGALALVVARRLSGQSLQVFLGGGGVFAYLGGLFYAALQAYAADGHTSDPMGPALFALGAAALVAAYVAWDARELAPVQIASAGAATAALLLGAFAPIQRNLGPDPADAWGAALLVAALAVVCAPRIATAPWRAGPLAVVGAGFAAAVAAMGEPLGSLVSGTLGWLDEPWSAADASGSAREMLSEPWLGTGIVPVTLALLTAGAALAAWRLRSGLAVVAAGALGTATAVAAPVAADLPYLVSVLSYVAVGGALLTAAARLYGRTVTAALADGDGDGSGQKSSKDVMTAAGLAVAGGCAAALGLGWAMATSTATAWALVVGLAAAAAAHLADPRTDKPAPVAAASFLLTGEAVVVALLADARGVVAGFVGVVTASVIALAAGQLASRPDTAGRLPAGRVNERLALETTAVCAAVLSFCATAADPIWASNALLAAGTAAALIALQPDRRPVAWLSFVLVTASSWVRLAEANVATPEAYTTGPALALLVAGWWNRRGTPEEPPASLRAGQAPTARSSWAAYAPGLSMGLFPSLIRVADDAGETGHGLDRPLLLGLAALVVLLVGVRAKLQAPLLIGAAVLATDAVILLAPYAQAVPRWVSIGGAGILLLTLGATYEKRLRDVSRLKDKIEALG